MFCYLVCRIWWYWRDVLVLRHDSKRETDWCQLILLTVMNIEVMESMLWTVKSPPTVYAQMKSRLCITLGCVTLPRRFRLDIVFGGEVWRLTKTRQRLTLLIYCVAMYCVQFCFLVHFRRCSVVVILISAWYFSSSVLQGHVACMSDIYVRGVSEESKWNLREVFVTI